MWFFPIFRSLLKMSVLPTAVVVSSKQNEDGKFVYVVPSVSVQEALVQAVEIAETCCELMRSAKLDTDLFRYLNWFPLSKYPRFCSTGWGAWVGRWVFWLSITVFLWLFCSSYHPSCADLAASVVPCRDAWVLGRRFGGAGSIGQTAVWTLLWFTEWLSVICWAVMFQGGICRSTSDHFVLFVESYDGIMHVRHMSMVTLSRVSRPSFGRLWPSGLVLVVWCPCRCRPWT